MALSKGYTSITLEDILKQYTEIDILYYYMGIMKIPCLINSPLRRDAHPSFGIYTKDGISIHYKDFSTGESGGLFDLLGELWRCSFKDTINQVAKDLYNIPKGDIHILKTNSSSINLSSNFKGSQTSDKYWSTSASTSLQVKVREWRDYDIAYWESYGIELKYLQYAEVYPISHIFIIHKDLEDEADSIEYVIPADKYAYTFVEHKEGHTTIKIYQPFNIKGHKWYTKHDRSVVGLWTKVPEYGEQICICSSLKDALCLWIHTGIPSIYLQGEGYGMSETAINELKRRYKQVYICFDNDAAGISNGVRLSKQTGFINIVLPEFKGGKDLSDLFHNKGREEFKKRVVPLFTTL